LRRVIQTMVEDKLSEMLLHDELKPGDTVRLERQDEEISVSLDRKSDEISLGSNTSA